jgi:hypothetical protein
MYNISMIPSDTPITYNILERSSFSYRQEDEHKTPPDFALEGLSDNLDTEEVQALKGAFNDPDMIWEDVLCINLFCQIAQHEKMRPLQFTDRIGINVPPKYHRGFQRVGDVWERVGIIPKQANVSSEELNQMWAE